MTWDELTLEISKGVYRIEMAEGFIPVHEADARWDRLEERRIADMKRGAHVCDEHDNIMRTVGCALIVMKRMGLVDYE